MAKIEALKEIENDLKKAVLFHRRVLQKIADIEISKVREQDEISDLQDEIEDLKSEISDLKSEISDLEYESEKLESKVEKLEEERPESIWDIPESEGHKDMNLKQFEAFQIIMKVVKNNPDHIINTYKNESISI